MPKAKKSENQESPVVEETPIEKKQKKKISEVEYEKEIIEFSKAGLTAEKIGEKLRQKGIHPKEYSKKISKVLKEKNIYVNPDLKNVGEKLEKIKLHYSKNKQDKRAMREKDRIFSHKKKLTEYYSKKD